MSRPRYGWWSYVKSMIRRYPALKSQYAELHSMSITPSYSGMPSSSGQSRSLETVAIRELPSTSQREYEAVRSAVEATERYYNGRDRLTVIKLTLWDNTHTIQGAAMQIPCSWRTAAQWHGEFIRMVARFYGLMDE